MHAPGLEYVGPLGFDLLGTHVVRHHYVDAPRGKDAARAVRRQLIVQLEWFPADSASTYRWRVEHPVRLGGIEHEHGVYAWSVVEHMRADAAAEVAQTAGFLARHGFVQGDGQLMSRFARVVGEARQRELIVFYQEDLDHLGLRLDEVTDEHGDLRAEMAELAARVTERSLAAFEVDESYAFLGIDD